MNLSVDVAIIVTETKASDELRYPATAVEAVSKTNNFSQVSGSTRGLTLQPVIGTKKAGHKIRINNKASLRHIVHKNDCPNDQVTLLEKDALCVAFMRNSGK